MKRTNRERKSSAYYTERHLIRPDLKVEIDVAGVGKVALRLPTWAAPTLWLEERTDELIALMERRDDHDV